MFGERKSGTFGSGQSEKNTADVDGFIVANIYLSASIPQGINNCVLHASTKAGGTTTSSTATSSLNSNVKTDSGKGGGDILLRFSTNSSLTLPVRCGENWQLSFSNAVEGIECAWYFVPLSSDSASNPGNTVTASNPADRLLQSIQRGHGPALRTSGSVAVLGERQTGSFGNQENATNSATTDGLLVASIFEKGHPPVGISNCVLQAATKLGDDTTSSAGVSSLNVNEKTDSGKGGYEQTVRYSTCGSMTVSVRSSETWELSIVNGNENIECVWYFVPLLLEDSDAAQSGGLGPRQSGSFGTGSSAQAQATADGFLSATVFLSAGVPEGIYCCDLRAVTIDNGTNTSSAGASSLNVNQISASGKGGGERALRFSTSGALTLPVKHGETWHLSLVNGIANLECSWFFTPLCNIDSNTSATLTAPSATDSKPDNAADRLLEAIKQNDGPALLTSDQPSQASIDRRMNDLTNILVQTTPFSEDNTSKEQFMSQLSKVVCSVDQDTGKISNHVESQDVAAVAETFAQLSQRTLTMEEKQLFVRGISALIDINANAENRTNVVLINRNIETFLAALQAAMHITLSKQDKRLLKIALTRIVGDGRQAVAA